MESNVSKGESARMTWKDALIILFLIFYAWFAYDEEDSSPPKQSVHSFQPSHGS